MSSPIDIYNYPSDPSLVPEYRVAIMQAALAGMPVQFRTRLVTASSWNSTATPCWNWELFDYRIDPDSKPAPAKEWRTWTFDTAPRLNVLLRPTVNRAVHRIPIGWEREGINLLNGWISYPGLLDKWEHSLDNGKSWSRCGVETESL